MSSSSQRDQRIERKCKNSNDLLEYILITNPWQQTKESFGESEPLKGKPSHNENRGICAIKINGLMGFYVGSGKM